MKVKIERGGDRVILAADRPVNKSMLPPGAYFRKDKTWSLPLDLTTCTLLRQAFGPQLEIGPHLWSWAKAAKQARQTALALAGSADADLRVLPGVAPFLSQAMSTRTYQRVAARYVADSASKDGRRRALLADTVGLGKTAEALAGVLESGAVGPFLIVCPKTAVNSTWKRQLNQWLPEDEVITLPDGKAGRENILNSLVQRSGDLQRSWVVVHPYAIRTQTWWECLAEEVDVAGTRMACGARTKYKAGVVTELDCGHEKARNTSILHEHVFPQLFDISYGAVIVDESDQILIRLSGTPNLQRRGAEMLRDLVRPGGVRLAMSGTPTRSKPHQIWSTLNWLDPKRFSAKWAFIQRFWKTESGFYGGMTIGELNEEQEALLDAELSDIMLRRTRDDVRGDLPEKLYAGTPLRGDGPTGVWLDLTPKQRKAYDSIAKTAEADIEGGKLSPIGVLAELTRMRQFAGSEGAIVNGEYQPLAAGNKYEWIVSFLKELGFPGQPATKVVIASQFTKLLKAFGEGIARDKELSGKDSALRVGYITGEETQSRRDSNIASFEESDEGLNVLFLNTKAGGSSITLDAAEVMVIIDETYVADEQEQLEGRIDNREPERRIVPRTYYYLRSLDTLEEKIAMANEEAKMAGKRLLDGGARELARRVMR